MKDTKAFGIILLVMFGTVLATVTFCNMMYDNQPVNQTVNATNDTVDEVVQTTEVQSSSDSYYDVKTYNINGKEYTGHNLMEADDKAYHEQQAMK